MRPTDPGSAFLGPAFCTALSGPSRMAQEAARTGQWTGCCDRKPGFRVGSLSPHLRADATAVDRTDTQPSWDGNAVRRRAWPTGVVRPHRTSPAARPGSRLAAGREEGDLSRGPNHSHGRPPRPDYYRGTGGALEHDPDRSSAHGLLGAARHSLPELFLKAGGQDPRLPPGLGRMSS